MKQNTHFHRWCPGTPHGQAGRTGEKMRLIEGEESFHGEMKMDHDRWIVYINGPNFGCVLGRAVAIIEHGG
jgi:hypothetical protein